MNVRRLSTVCERSYSQQLLHSITSYDQGQRYAGWYLVGRTGGHVLVTGFRDMALVNGLFCADVLRSPDLVPSLPTPPWRYVIR